jgi:hypothetical protein
MVEEDGWNTDAHGKVAEKTLRQQIREDPFSSVFFSVPFFISVRIRFFRGNQHSASFFKKNAPASTSIRAHP